MRTQVYTQSSVNRYHCLSTDTKPTGCPNGSILFEMDTDKKYKYDAENDVWYIQTSGSGSGGGGDKGDPSSKNDVVFYDYDGSIVRSYSASEFASISVMPENPSHDGLTAQGWNWSLSDAKAYVETHGKLNIGQMYVTSDGKTRIYIELSNGRLSPYLKLYLNANSSLNIDWGDGSANSVLSSTTEGYKVGFHTYASAGNYVITITVISGGFNFQYMEGSKSNLLTDNNNDSRSPDIGYLNSVKRIEIGDAVTTIGQYAFAYCYSLASITIPKSVTNMGFSSLAWCISLKSVTIPSSVSAIEQAAFAYCYSLVNVAIPTSITSIGTSVFSNCYSLSNIAIPSSVTSIGSSDFSGCYSLSNITIPSSVISIGSKAFSNCYSLSDITIPSSVESIGNYAFSGCYSLSDITIPSSVTSISDYAFSGCYSLSDITIPSSVTSIGSHAFSNCYSLSSVTINRSSGSLSGSPWGAITTSPTSTKIVWTA